MALAAIKLTEADIALYTGMYVDTDGNPDEPFRGGLAEAYNMEASLDLLGHNVSPFTTTEAGGIAAALAGKDVLVIPELETSIGGGAPPNLQSALSDAAKDAIRDFVADGKTLVINATIFDLKALDFLNHVFGFALADVAEGASSQTAGAAGTTFADDAASIPVLTATNAIDETSLPEESVVFYATSEGDATVAGIPYGSGQIIFLGWDWTFAEPHGDQDGGWLEVLDSAISATAPDSTIIGTPAGETLTGTAGDDLIIGYAGADHLLGLDGNDVLIGGITYEELDIEGGQRDSAYLDHLEGGAGDDILDGGRGIDTLDGGDGNDTFRIWAGDYGPTWFDTPETVDFWKLDRIDGGAGINTVDFSGFPADKFEYDEDVAVLVDLVNVGLWQNVENIIGTSRSDKLYGNAADNVIDSNRGSIGAVEILDGRGGNDTLILYGYQAEAYGGTGDDLYLFKDWQNEAALLDGGAGFDSVSLAVLSDFIDKGVAVSLTGDIGAYNPADYDVAIEDITFISVEGVVGTAHDDLLIGDAVANRLEGGDGSDRILGNGGDDYVRAGDGGDNVSGGDGNDHIVGDAGSDTLYGDAGDDFLQGGVLYSEVDTDAGDTNDPFGNDRLYGGNGNDILEGGRATDELFGEAGNDTFRIWAGDYSPSWFDTPETADFTAIDRLHGGDGDDTVDFSGFPADVFESDETIGVLVDLANGIWNSVENIVGIGGHSDKLYGDHADNVIDGAGGSNSGEVEVLDGRNGNDTLILHGTQVLAYGGKHDDLFLFRYASPEDPQVIDGGSGFDTVSFAELGVSGTGDRDGISVSLAERFGSYDPFAYGAIMDDAVFHYVERVIGTAEEDLIIGDSRDNVLEGGRAADTISAAGGNDHVIGGDGDDVLVGGSGEDVIEGGWGYDYLSGKSGDDLLSGGKGNDDLRGGEDDDRLLGGGGLDAMTGGEGSDTFVLGDGLLLGGNVVGTGLATIGDFQTGEDLLEASAAIFGTTDFDLVVGSGGPTSGDATFIFNPATELLAFDKDGTGSAAAVTIARLIGVETLSMADFLIV